MFLVIVLYAVLAATFTLAKNALFYASPCFLIGFRMILAGSILLGYQLFKNPGVLKNIKPAHYSKFFVTALFHIYCAFVLEFWALQYISALKTVLIYSLTPFISALLAYLLLGHKLTKLKVAGIIIGTTGLAPVLLSQSTGEQAFSTIFSLSVPEVVLLGAVFSAAYAWFRVKELMDKGYHFALINGITMLIGGILSLLTSFIVEGFQPPVSDWSGFLFWVLLLVLFANGIFYNMYGWLMNRYSITFISFAGFLCPTFATLFEWLFFSGVITWHYLLCLVLVTGGLWLFYKDELKTA